MLRKPLEKRYRRIETNLHVTRSSCSTRIRRPHYHGHRDRLRARFVEVGGDALPDYELLELVLFRSIPRRDVKPLAKALITRFGGFAEVIAAAPGRLAEIGGLGEATITDLKIVEARRPTARQGARCRSAPCCRPGAP